MSSGSTAAVSADAANAAVSGGGKRGTAGLVFAGSSIDPQIAADLLAFRNLRHMSLGESQRVGIAMPLFSSHIREALIATGVDNPQVLPGDEEALSQPVLHNALMDRYQKRDRGFAKMFQMEPEYVHQKLHFFIPRKLWGYWSGFQGISRTTEYNRAFWTAFLSFCSALSNISLGSSPDELIEPSQNYYRTTNFADRAGQMISVPKMRVFFEFIASDKHDPTQHNHIGEDFESKFDPENFIGVDIQVMILDPHFWAGGAFNAEIWHNMLLNGDISQPQYEVKLQMLRLLTSEPSIMERYNDAMKAVSSSLGADPEDDDSDEAESENRREIPLDGFHGGEEQEQRRSGGGRASAASVTYIDTVVGIASQGRGSVKKGTVDTVHLLPVLNGGSYHSNMTLIHERDATEEYYRTCQERASQGLDLPQKPQRAHIGGSSYGSMINQKKDDIRQQEARRQYAAHRDSRGTDSASEVLKMNETYLRSVSALVKLMYVYTQNEELQRLLANQNGDPSYYNLSDKNSPINPVRVFSFENSRKLIRKCVEGTGVAPWNEQMHQDHYVCRKTGLVIPSPDPELVVQVGQMTLRPEVLFSYYMPFYRNPHERLLEKYEKEFLNGGRKRGNGAQSAVTVARMDQDEDTGDRDGNDPKKVPVKYISDGNVAKAIATTDKVSIPHMKEECDLVMNILRQKRKHERECMPTNDRYSDGQDFFAGINAEGIRQDLPRMSDGQKREEYKIDSPTTHEIWRMEALRKRTMRLVVRVRSKGEQEEKRQTDKAAETNRFYVIEKELIRSFRREALRVFQISYSPDMLTQVTVGQASMITFMRPKIESKDFRHAWWPNYNRFSNLSIFANQRVLKVIKIEYHALSYNQHALYVTVMCNFAVDAYDIGATNGLHMAVIGPLSVGKSAMMAHIAKCLPNGIARVVDASSDHAFHTMDILDNLLFIIEEGEKLFAASNRSAPMQPKDVARMAMQKSILSNRRARIVRHQFEPGTNRPVQQAYDVSCHCTFIHLYNYMQIRDEDSAGSRFSRAWCSNPTRRDMSVTQFQSREKDPLVMQNAELEKARFAEEAALAHRIIQASRGGLLPDLGQGTSYASVFIRKFVERIRMYVANDPPSRAVNRCFRLNITNVINFARDTGFSGETSPFIDIDETHDGMFKMGRVKGYEERDISQVGPYLYATHDICVFSASQGFREWYSPEVVRLVQFIARFTCKFDEIYFRKAYRAARDMGAILMPKWENAWRERNPDLDKKLKGQERKAAIRKSEPSILQEYRTWIKEMRYCAYGMAGNTSSDERYAIRFAPKKLHEVKFNPAAAASVNASVQAFAAANNAPAAPVNISPTGDAEAQRLAEENQKSTMAAAARAGSTRPGDDVEADVEPAPMKKGSMSKRRRDEDLQSKTKKPDTKDESTAATTKAEVSAYDPMYICFDGSIDEMVRSCASVHERFGTTDVNVLRNQLDTLRASDIQVPVLMPIATPMSPIEFVRNQNAKTGAAQIMWTRTKVIREFSRGEKTQVFISTHWLMYNYFALMCEALTAAEDKNTRSETTVIDYAPLQHPYVLHTFDIAPKPEVEVSYTRRDAYVVALMKDIYPRMMRSMDSDEYDRKVSGNDAMSFNAGVSENKSQKQQRKKKAHASLEDIEAEVNAAAQNNNNAADEKTNAATAAIKEAAKEYDKKVSAATDSTKSENYEDLIKQIRGNMDRDDPLDGPYNSMLLPESFDQPVDVGTTINGESLDQKMYRQFYINNYGKLASVDVETQPWYPGNLRKYSNRLFNTVKDLSSCKQVTYPDYYINMLDEGARDRALGNGAVPGGRSRAIASSCTMPTSPEQEKETTRIWETEYGKFKHYYTLHASPDDVVSLAIAMQNADLAAAATESGDAHYQVDVDVQGQASSVISAEVRQQLASGSVRFDANVTQAPAPAAATNSNDQSAAPAASSLKQSKISTTHALPPRRKPAPPVVKSYGAPKTQK